LAYPVVLRPDAGLSRSSFQGALEERGVDTRMVWTGNVTRQPMLRDVEFRVDPHGYPNADHVMAHAVLLPCNHFMSDDDVDFVCEAVDAVLPSP
jgi:CDP-6-deoxy-D-xylo-4-hexulose-3-dehydrase